MGSKYQRKFSGKSEAEGSKTLLSAVESASHHADDGKTHKSAPYESGFMIAGGHAMTSVEIIRKD